MTWRRRVPWCGSRKNAPAAPAPAPAMKVAAFKVLDDDELIRLLLVGFAYSRGYPGAGRENGLRQVANGRRSGVRRLALRAASVRALPGLAGLADLLGAARPADTHRGVGQVGGLRCARRMPAPQSREGVNPTHHPRIEDDARRGALDCCDQGPRRAIEAAEARAALEPLRAPL